MSPTKQFAAGLAEGIDLALDALDDRLDHQSRELLAELGRNIASLAERGTLADDWREAIEPRLADLCRIFPPPAPAPRPAAAAPPTPRPTTPPKPAPAARRRPAVPLFTDPQRKPLFPSR